mmetsp:Transcript_4562/g.11755  ORF Transcript_4562/g.11755 Transcript_4562/m.11755 type:complete len:182 (+) Transcript_4562:84-629(+)
MATAVSMIAEQMINACCGGDGKFGKFGNKPTAQESKNNKVDPKFKKNFTNKQMKFELTEWKKLPPKARKAAEKLGYSEESWNDCEAVDVSWESWSDLSDDEKANLEILGWEEIAWESQYQETDWKELPELQKKAAMIAGYDEYTWDEVGSVENLNKDWEDLSEKEQEALCVMGWHERKWDE